MSKSSCLARQKIANTNGAWAPRSIAPDPGCRDCEQGKAIRKELALKTNKVKVKAEAMEENAKKFIESVTPCQLEPDTLIIDFTKHSDVLSKIMKIAEEELRTPEAQALWFLRSCLKTKGN